MTALRKYWLEALFVVALAASPIGPRLLSALGHAVAAQTEGFSLAFFSSF